MEPPVINNTVSDRLRAGVNVFLNISVKDPAALKAFIEEETAAVKESHSREQPPGFAFSRKLYRSFSVDPTKHRPSSEALWRRIKKGLDFPFVHPGVDLTNCLSLRYQVSYGLYDLDKIAGEIEIGRGRAGDSYRGIRKDVLNMEGKILLRDATGPFGNPSADSLRTSTSEKTANLVQVIFFHIDDPSAEVIPAASRERYVEFFEMSDSLSFIV